MLEQEFKRYQAGRCDAHGNRIIADDQDYLRGWFAAFMDLPYNPFLWKEGTAVCPLDRINYRRVCIRIDRLVAAYRSMDAYDAFDGAREVL